MSRHLHHTRLLQADHHPGCHAPQVTQYVERELMTHRLLWHPHVIKLYKVFLTSTHLAVVLEYAGSVCIGHMCAAIGVDPPVYSPPTWCPCLLQIVVICMIL